MLFNPKPLNPKPRTYPLFWGGGNPPNKKKVALLAFRRGFILAARAEAEDAGPEAPQGQPTLRAWNRGV